LGVNDENDEVASVASLQDVPPAVAEKLHFLDMTTEEQLAVVSKSTDLVTARAVLAALPDNTASRWCRRSLTQPKVIKAWAVTSSSEHVHRASTDALRVIKYFEFPQGLVSADQHTQAEDWHVCRTQLINALRDCLTTGCDMEAVLRRLMAAAQSVKHGNLRVYDHARATLDDSMFEDFAPLAAECLVWKLDLSYRTDRPHRQRLGRGRL